jgi:hypothetical protein
MKPDTRHPLIAVLKTAALELVQEIPLPLDHFPDMIELEQPAADPPEDAPLPRIVLGEFKQTPHADRIVPADNRGQIIAHFPPPAVRQFFRFQISDRRAYYREGTRYRIPA